MTDRIRRDSYKYERMIMNRIDLKRNFLYLLACILPLCVAGCGGGGEDGGEPTPPPAPEKPSLEVKQTAFADVDATGTTLSLSVESNVKWTVASDKVWCLLPEGEKQGSGTLQITVDENYWTEGRSATLTLTTTEGGLKKQVSVSQKGVVWKENHTYKLPVVFHVLYAREDNRQQYTDPGHLQKVIDNVNLLYKNCGVEMNLEFVMAPEDPNGNALEEPGVHRVQWSPSIMDCNAFMKSDDEKYLDLMWDQNRYINIVLYTFNDNNLMGYSSFPYTVAPAELEGCEQLTSAINAKQLNHPQCVSINNKFIYDMRDDYTKHCNATTYIPSDIVWTIAHEVGHYLSLRHAFSEDANASSVNAAYDTCINSDFCADTPSYNKYRYNLILQGFGADYPKHFDELVKRTDCETGEEFISTNIMDYVVTYGYSFTGNQKNRIRYILENGIFIPGPKKSQPQSRALMGTEKVVLPIRCME